MDTEKIIEVNPNEVTEITPSLKLQEGERLTDEKIEQFEKLLNTIKDQVKMMEEIWRITMKEFNINSDILNKLDTYNREHRIPMPENLSDEEKEKWDRFNGLDNITEEEAINIFGEGSNVIGITHDITKNRIKEIAQDGFNYTETIIEYNKIVNEYNRLLEESHIADMEELKIIMENETDPEKKEILKNAIDQYWANRYLDFLATPLVANDREWFIKTFNNKEKFKYCLNRAMEKLEKLNINTNFIYEIAKFESRFLDEKYDKIHNMLLLYFVRTAAYCDPSIKSHEGCRRVACMFMAIDSIVRDTAKPEVKERILNNIYAFEDQLIDSI